VFIVLFVLMNDIVGMYGLNILFCVGLHLASKTVIVYNEYMLLFYLILFCIINNYMY
jgi:hypothetical protein